jgi:segregation and condensation protein B
MSQTDPQTPPPAEENEIEVVEEEAVEAVDIAELGEAVDIAELAEDRPAISDDATLRATIEAIVYVTEEPVMAKQIADALEQTEEKITAVLAELVKEYEDGQRGIMIRQVAGGYRMGTRPDMHEPLKHFARSLRPPLKLSLAALETLAVIAYKQPITAPEIMEVRGVQGAGVLSTLLQRKLIATAGRRNVVGKPILYKTTKEFLLQFGLRDLAELPTLKEFEELKRLALDTEPLLPEGAAGSNGNSEAPAPDSEESIRAEAEQLSEAEAEKSE